MKFNTTIWHLLGQTEQTRVSVSVFCDQPHLWPCRGTASTVPAQGTQGRCGVRNYPVTARCCLPPTHHEMAIDTYILKNTKGTPPSHTYPQQGCLSIRSLHCWFDPFFRRMHSPDPLRPRETHQVSF